MLKDKYAIIKLCKFLGCSKSGYYDWVKAGRPEFKAFDEVTNKLILKHMTNIVNKVFAQLE